MVGDASRALARHVGLAMVLSLGLAGAADPVRGQSAQYEFAVPPSDERNIAWRIDTLSGEIGMCYFGKDRRHPLGFLTCPNRGEGAGVQSQPGPYGLVSSNREDEMGIFRVNRRTGTMSLCYELDDRKGHRIVCTEPNR